MIKELTCIVCPVGCRISVETDKSGDIASITGNSCPKGAKYAEAEIRDPRRTVTSTVSVKNRPGIYLPVKTSSPVPKDRIFDVMERINSVSAEAPVSIGNVIIKDVYPGINIIATADVD